MPMAERLEPSIVYEVLTAEKPGTVQQLVDGISKRISATQSEIVSLLLAMMRSGELKVKPKSGELKAKPNLWEHKAEQKIDAPSIDLTRFEGNNSHQPRRFSLVGFVRRVVNVLVQLLPYRNENVLKALSSVLVFNTISWIIILFFQTNVMLGPFRIIFHGINLLFLPGFTMTILWYPFPSALLDFTKLDRKIRVRDGRVLEDQSRVRVLDPFARVTYSICYSIGLVILLGFLIGLLGNGFDIKLMQSLLSAIEIVIIFVVLFRLQKILDPYLNI